MTHGSLFSGIGGFDLASHWMGWKNIFQVEKDKWCRKVLEKNFPETIRYEDIKDFNGKKYEGAIDVISGGFPCQPFSVAGKQRGKDDDRYLWEEMLRVISEVNPTFVVGENVTGIIGMALDTVLSDLEIQGYTTETFIIPACSKNAWHRRDRVWILSYTNSYADRWGRGQNGEANSISQVNRQEVCAGKSCRTGEIHAHTTEQGFQNRRRTPLANTRETEQEPERFCGDGKQLQDVTNANNTGCKEQWEQFTDGQKLFAPQCSSWWEAEPGICRVVDGLPNRVDRLKGLGNAIAPQIAFEIFKTISTP